MSREQDVSPLADEEKNREEEVLPLTLGPDLDMDIPPSQGVGVREVSAPEEEDRRGTE